jgi:hypothetical protein
MGPISFFVLLSFSLFRLNLATLPYTYILYQLCLYQRNTSLHGTDTNKLPPPMKRIIMDGKLTPSLCHRATRDSYSIMRQYHHGSWIVRYGSSDSDEEENGIRRCTCLVSTPFGLFQCGRHSADIRLLYTHSEKSSDVGGTWNLNR